ncbi:MAG: CheR family methyltransferase [Thermonemataceae bacterium]
MQLSDAELKALNEGIYHRYKIDFSSYEPHSLKRRMSKAMAHFGFKNSVALWDHLLYHQDFIYEFIDEITVQLTSLFRDANFWIGLRKEILPTFEASTPLHIWHAGCATGQEVYSMMILLEELNRLSQAYITATDISQKAINTTLEATYPLEELDNFKRSYLAAGGRKAVEKYLRETEVGWQFHQLAPTSLRIFQHNVAKDPVEKTYDLIFCRNVLIYFDVALKAQVLERLHQSLKPEGLLLLGYFDTLPVMHEDLFERHHPRLKIFKKR